MSDNQPKKTASERIKNLEDALLGTIKAVNGQANEQEIIKEALRLLSNKLDSAIQLIRSGQDLSEENLSTVMIQNKANKLDQDVQAAVNTGLLSKSDVVTEKSFVVSREVLDDGTVINPRFQFAVENAQEPLKGKVLGAKVLDKLIIQEGKALLEIMEVYSFSEPPAANSPTPTEATAEDLAASSDATATPAVEANSTAQPAAQV